MKLRRLSVLLFALLLIPVFGFSQEWSANHIHAHAHNDYEHTHPLQDALDQGFYSIEADIWLVNGDLLVGHNKGEYKGTLKDLYLNPLQEFVTKNGSVHNDGKTVLLWLDLKDGRPELRMVLHNMLKKYPMLSTFSNDKSNIKAVTVILTGDAKSKMAYGSEYPLRYACCDSNNYSPDDPPANSHWQWYALHWGSYIHWDGIEPIRPDQLNKLKEIIKDIHAKGRKVRFYATPETKAYWQLALDLGIDLINTDKLSELNKFLQETNKK